MENRIVKTRVVLDTPGEKYTKDGNADKLEHTRATVKCYNGTEVVVDYVMDIGEPFLRHREPWVLIHSWTKTWKEGSRSFTTWINLTSGETYETIYFSGRRSGTKISPNGDLIYFWWYDGYSVSTDVYDIKDLDNLVCVYSHERWSKFQTDVLFEDDMFIVEYKYSDDGYKYYHLGQREGAEPDDDYTEDKIVRKYYRLKDEFNKDEFNKDVSEDGTDQGISVDLHRVELVKETIMCGHCRRDF